MKDFTKSTAMKMKRYTTAFATNAKTQGVLRTSISIGFHTIQQRCPFLTVIVTKQVPGLIAQRLQRLWFHHGRNVFFHRDGFFMFRVRIGGGQDDVVLAKVSQYVRFGDVFQKVLIVP